MSAGSPRERILLSTAFLLGLTVALLSAALWVPHVQSQSADRAAIETLKSLYRRPDSVPFPRDNPPTPEKIRLGATLFAEKLLSSDATVSCASCHDPALAFGDGVEIGRGVPKVPLDRHTPGLWNLAWAEALFWDGRAGTLEEQARGPIENPKEMAIRVEEGVGRLAADPGYVAAFRESFPEDPAVNATNLLKALAAFERTIVSPRTRFDAWIESDGTALTSEEIAGFLLFNGKAGCSNCHAGWNFTDHSFHDIGLPGTDRGRGKILGLNDLDQAFKTPSLRELVWTAPFMHDGSLASLDDVLRHYETGGIARRTRSKEMPNAVALDAGERNALLAFLETLSSERPPRPVETATFGREEAIVETVATSVVRQRNKSFSPGSVTLTAGESLTVLNDDVRPHNFRIHSTALKLDSGVQQPGDKTVFPLPQPGVFEAFCGIHPSMKLTIVVR